MVSWQEVDGITVAHVEDFEFNHFESRITFPDLTFVRCNGCMEPTL